MAILITDPDSIFFLLMQFEYFSVIWYNHDFWASLKFGLNKFNLYILQAIQLMKDQPAQTKSKKWVDYSDSESSDQESHQQSQHDKSKHPHKRPEPQPAQKKITYVPSKQETNAELDKLDDLNHDKVQEVWLDVFSQNIEYLEDEMQNLKKKARKGGNIVAVYPGKEKERYEIKVYIDVAYDYIQKGYDDHDYVKVTVSPRNFQRRRNERPPRPRQRQSYKQEKGDKYNEAKDNEKKKYVDKQTGKAPETVKKVSEAGNNQRKYTREEAEKKGQMIGEFRNKQSKVEESETVPEKKAETKKQQVVQKIPEQPVVQKVQKSSKQAESKKSKQAPKNEKKVKANKGKSQNPFEDMLDI